MVRCSPSFALRAEYKSPELMPDVPDCLIRPSKRLSMSSKSSLLRSAGVAAAMAVKGKLPVQKVNYAELRKKLLNLNQRLERPV